MTGKTLGTDLRKGKLTLPVIMLLRSASTVEKDRAAEFILQGNLSEMTRLVKAAAANGALSAAITSGRAMLDEAEERLTGLPANPYSEALLDVAAGIGELFDQMRS